MANAEYIELQNDGTTTVARRHSDSEILWDMHRYSDGLMRRLGGSVVEELFNKFGDDVADHRVIHHAQELADQEPPMPAAVSWQFYDGIRAALDTRWEAQAVRTEISQGVQS